ncbi:AbrB/MazE/SpoVT family DNA-binding domain-containing protein [Caviibacterium pharyngocola]|uniref:SpoVT-AbrB domain-containing protein n=1 Tax=Caviibacterium pharyngocola TaxID=28159 RepID=A0A2M8RWR7_9PAST|nr:AbrB/MazE/SpoVT family DNA-binding domain-containing protein [Caviibacterium pharyngocola]PJG83336.1 hypothetical protein CVP04_04225 [Caviibacterium pharyngocola]
MLETLILSKWGNSMAVRFPKSILAKFNLAEGDRLQIVSSPDNSKLILEPIRETMLGEEKILTPRDWQLILDLLDNPPKPTERLLKAAQALRENDNELA